MKIRQDLIKSFELVNQSEKRWLEEYKEMCKSDGVVDQVGLEQNTRYVSKNFGSVAGFNTELLINPLDQRLTIPIDARIPKILAFCEPLSVNKTDVVILEHTADFWKDRGGRVLHPNKDNMENSVAVLNNQIPSAASHEFGHILDFTLDRPSRDSKYFKDMIRTPFQQQIKEDVGVKRVYTFHENRGNEQSIKNLDAYVRYYTASKEVFAELFSNHVHSKLDLEFSEKHQSSVFHKYAQTFYKEHQESIDQFYENLYQPIYEQYYNTKSGLNVQSSNKGKQLPSVNFDY